jgi:hypothetical protein
MFRATLCSSSREQLCEYNFWYVYLNPLHVSSNPVLILRRTIVWIQLLVCLFESSACFKQPCAHPQEDNCVNTTSGIFIWILYMFQATLCSSSGGQLCEYNFWYIYLNPLHVSSNSVLILRRTIVWIQLLVYLFESTTCFKQFCAHPQEDNCVNTTPDSFI